MKQPLSRCILVSLFFVCIAAAPACKRGGSVTNSSSPTSTTTADGNQPTPPFPTREPQRFSATIVTSASLGQSSAVPGDVAIMTQQTFVARDGEKRREDSELIPGVKISYLQLPNARYVLFHAKKIYAEIKLGDAQSLTGPLQTVPSDFAPDKLVKGTPTGAKYEKLGTEEINGRMTTKYRVTVDSAAGTGVVTGVPGSETIVWADEALGMPIKIESTSNAGSKYSMEMRDIKLVADPALFELPADYQKVEHRELLSNVIPSLPNSAGNASRNGSK